MNNKGELSQSDIKNKYIYLNESASDLFKQFVNQKIKIVDQDDCEFFFDVKQSWHKKKHSFIYYLYQTQDFIIQWGLKKGDSLSFKYDIETFTVDITKKGGSNIPKETSNSLTEAITIDEKSKTDILRTISQTYQSVVNEYKNTFNKKYYLPTKASQSSLVINGFTERNLTFNFCHSYLSLKRNTNAIVWQEIPITSANRQHVDSIIIDKDWIIYIEAKRLYDLTHFELLLKDLDRIKEFHSDIPLPPTHPKNKAIVLLADHYFNGESKKKKDKDEIYDLFFSGQNVNVEPEIIKDHPRLADISSAKIRKVDIKEPSIEIPRENNYNISVWDDLVYTIYCGVYFLGEIEKA